MNNIPPNSPPPPPLPPPIPAYATQQKGDDTGGIIPYKNPHALTSYYLGIFSIIPLLGFILGCVALPLGISGLKQRRKNPVIRGAVHAWIGIICGGGSVALHLLIGILIAVAAASRR
jgi:hypothetical protein